MMTETNHVKVAVCQMEPVFGNLAVNTRNTVDAIGRAAGEGADILVLPELCSTGYMFASRQEAFALAEEAGTGPATSAWLNAAQETSTIVVGGFAERAGDLLYNSAFMALPSGQWALYRKAHLWDEEALYFEPGNLGFPVVATQLGRIGMLICYDGWFPEAYRSLADAGADLVCVPTNWVPLEGHPRDTQAMAVTLTQAAAHVNGMVVAAADRCGVERGQGFIGQSVIVSHTGVIAAGPAARDRPDFLTASVSLADARRSRTWGKFNHPLRDRRFDSYGRRAS